MNESLSQKVTETTSDLLISLANEPSLAYFHIQEHIRKSVPEILKYQLKVEHLDSQLRGSCYDLDYALDNVRSISKATVHFNRINELLKSSLFAKLQLDYARMNAPPVEVGIDLVSWDLNDEELLSLSHKEPRKRRPTQCNQNVHTDVSFQNKCTEIPTNSRTLSHISSTVSTAAVQVRDQAINLGRRVLWTQSADVSYSIISPILSDSKITNSSSSFDEKPKFLET
ncbi:BLOC-1- complex subunit 8, variant 3 [Schistosoma haematobium]|uniref:BLOC-1- complex subunit 8, variant 3 n=1 Tax=Schistosoma haematobium TaxID=6185 RepID=A0A922II06_SCHHA|nr:BLOC-1- complex subunit 8, variant 3 [Schistosoma haematobium]KAH9579218.1 BLOC-1- complex subunit 8, variant 3 [Schistosoma haematobium]CAH8630123.1 unnamed protein product [Schistosoma haematobium]